MTLDYREECSVAFYVIAASMEYHLTDQKELLEKGDIRVLASCFKGLKILEISLPQSEKILQSVNAILIDADLNLELRELKQVSKRNWELFSRIRAVQPHYQFRICRNFLRPL